jgi:hypothetical protein
MAAAVPRNAAARGAGGPAGVPACCCGRAGAALPPCGACPDPSAAAASGPPDPDLRLSEGRERVLFVSDRLPPALLRAAAAGALEW